MRTRFFICSSDFCSYTLEKCKYALSVLSTCKNFRGIKRDKPCKSFRTNKIKWNLSGKGNNSRAINVSTEIGLGVCVFNHAANVIMIILSKRLFLIKILLLTSLEKLLSDFSWAYATF